MVLSRHAFQDVDVGYSNKVDLEVKVESLRKELNFIRCVFEAVRIPHIRGLFLLQ